VFFVHEDFQRPQPEAGTGRRRWGASLAAILRARDTMAVLLVRLVTRTATRIISPVLPLFVAALLPETSALGAATMTGIVTAANSAATSIGAAVLGRTGDRVGHRRVLLASAAGTSVLYALQVVVTNTVQLTLLQFFLGVALAGTLSTMAALLAKSAPEGQHGTVFGLDSSIVSVANALGPMIGAATAVSCGNRATFLLAGGGFALATVIAAWLMPRS
jgi:DHA1 family multidrug resistance protein-like MFS transporter